MLMMPAKGDRSRGAGINGILGGPFLLLGASSLPVRPQPGILVGRASRRTGQKADLWILTWAWIKINLHLIYLLPLPALGSSP